MAERRPITPEQRQAIGGMWNDYHHPNDEDVIANEQRFRVDVPADDHNPAELVCKLMAEAFEEKARELRKLAESYAEGVPVPTMTVEDVADMIEDQMAQDAAAAAAKPVN